jgi:S-methyl-5-thioribose-1-phosphate isomerase
MSQLKAIKYDRLSLVVIDQLKLPHEVEYLTVADCKAAWHVIRNMNVRGAPLIALTAVLALAVEVNRRNRDFVEAEAAVSFLCDSMSYLQTSRPTAVNLFGATEELTRLVKSAVLQGGITGADVIRTYTDAAEAMFSLDLKVNIAIGSHGAVKILDVVPKKKIRVLTICNTGSLATTGHGTALGVVRSLHELGALEHVYACETRPYNQGARLTAFEIVQDKLPGTLIADSMAAALMSNGLVDCVVVGADRVTANGDVANKIGTYQLAIVAKYHRIPFFAAVPCTTLDLSMVCYT